MRRHRGNYARCAAVAAFAVGPIVGCSSERLRPAQPVRHGTSDYSIVTSDDTPRYSLRVNQSAITPAMGPHNRAPVYPPELLARAMPPVTLTATLIVGTDGQVKDVRFANSESTPDAAAFQHAVNTAVADWTFTPLRITTWKTQPDGSKVLVTDQAKPFSQAYEFRFKVVDGKGVVSSSDPPR